MPKPAKRIAVTGAAGQIAYALLFRIAQGDMLGRDQPVILQLLELPTAMPALNGLVMELEDCAFELLQDVVVTDNPEIAFKEADIALLIGSQPRRQGMERLDLLSVNAGIFIAQGRALNDSAHPNVKVLVVANPANTNTYIAMKSAPDLPKRNFTALLRLDHNRARTMLAKKVGKPVAAIDKLVVWGNHSPKMYPDLRFATVDGQSLAQHIHDEVWVWSREVFIPTVATRGTAVLAARGTSSAASAAQATLDHMRDWMGGSAWVTMGVPSDGAYGVPEDMVYGFPVATDQGEYRIIQGLDIDALSRERMDRAIQELQQELESVQTLLT